MHGALQFSVTAANIHDSHEVPNLLFGDETRFYGERAYRGKEQRKRLKALAPRAKVEPPFLVLKRLWGFAKVRDRGLAKNANRAFAMRALHNLIKWGKPLTGEVRPR
jgi:IS5 family transposase